MNIKIDIKIPSQREYRKMHWGLREAKKFEMTKMIKDTLILHNQPAQRATNIMLIIGGVVLPEHCYISPLMATLRSTGWVSDDCMISIQSDKQLKGVTVCL
jgi:hypothetical protein